MAGARAGLGIWIRIKTIHNPRGAKPGHATRTSMKLHIGGRRVKEGWKILNIQPVPGVDYIGNIGDLSQFPDRSIDEIYASHVLEHVHQAAVAPTLAGIYRVLKSKGKLMIAVPDMDVLCRMFLRTDLDMNAHFEVMRMMFGGQIDPHDFHFFGWNFEFMRHFLDDAGFIGVERVESFGLFDDNSELRPLGERISLNVVAVK
jgi:predicted SAM-dependent methyltransferase